MEAENEDVVRRLIDEAVNAHRADLLEEFVRADVCVHPGTAGSAPDTDGVEELRTAFERFRSVFPDLHITVDDTVARDDRVAVRWTARATHAGELAAIPPTGRSVEWSGIDIYRLDEARIVEWWRNDDFVWLLHQLGRDVLTPD